MSTQIKFRGLVLGLLLVVLGYTALWYTVGFRTQKMISATLAGWLDAGMRVDHGAIELSGFPYRVVVSIDNLSVATRARGLDLATDKLTLISHLWTPQHWIVQADGAAASLADGLLAFEEDYLEASYRVHDGDRLVIKIDSGGAEDMTWRAPSRMPTLDAWTLMLGKDNGDSLAANGLYEKRTLEARLYARQGTQTLQATFGVSGPGIRDWTADELARWRDEGGLVAIDALDLATSGTLVALKGDIALDEAFRPLGSAAIEVSDWDAFAQLMRRIGISVGSAPADAVMVQNGALMVGDQLALRLPPVIDER